MSVHSSLYRSSRGLDDYSEDENSMLADMFVETSNIKNISTCVSDSDFS